MRDKLFRPGDLGQALILGILTGITIAVVFAAGFFARDIIQLSPALAASTGSGEYLLLDEVQALINQNYLREQPDPTHRVYGAVRGMLATFNDPYTFFIDPPVAQSESDVLAGTYGGIGVQVNRNEMGEFILLPFADSPAQAAGIEDGDILIAINGEDVEITTRQDVVDQQMRGEVRDDHGVEITIKKRRDDTLITVFIPFAVINVPSVIWRQLDEDPTIGLVQILRFTSRTPEELRNAIADLEQRAIDSLVLDLRNNSGGLLQESIAVADEFLDGGVVVYEVTQQSERTFRAEPGGSITNLPLIVLVNRGTASASELVAGAIQDNNRGMLIGQNTFGKGTVQQIFRLSDQSSLHITSAEWLTPSRSRLDQVGLTPDIYMIPDPNGRDVELGEAIRWLQQYEVTEAAS